MQLKKISSWLAAALLLVMHAACTKTETTPYEELPQNRLLSYRIVNAQDTIKGAVNEKEKTITVYLPSTVFLSLLEPEIVVSPGATVTPESGSFIEDMVDYFTNGRKIEYTVTGADKTTSTYTLKIISLQPEIAFREVTTDPATPLTFNHSISWYYSDNVILLESVSTYAFNYPAVMKGWLIGEDGTEYPFSSVDGGSTPLLRLAAINGYAYGVTTSPPAGLYKVKVQYYSKFTTLANPIKIEYK
ncbi:MAG: hypothetical protein P0Y53_24035 [Candidatus Pseudobacter hemicellulosilyticus]|uniref:DUF5018 domain-containing protein n=1 Tax=Candidatus Pseudobacter hemicellulosilyticus TaxID=3121375 RepID=A0AAJ5WRC5_9BACT|nr:MAG: hypothetical protein P0Y53_24035 [Pseudobacter sp.]